MLNAVSVCFYACVCPGMNQSVGLNTYNLAEVVFVDPVPEYLQYDQMIGLVQHTAKPSAFDQLFRPAAAPRLSCHVCLLKSASFQSGQCRSESR